MLSRRELLQGAAALLGGLGGCAGRTTPPLAPPTTTASLLPATGSTFPLLDVCGSPYAMGRAIGERFAPQIRAAFSLEIRGWRELKTFADAQPALLEPFLAAARRLAPTVLDELRGWADGSGVPLHDLLALNHKGELGALRDERGRERRQCVRAEGEPGCSTIIARRGTRTVWAHNEDGDGAYAPGMFLLRARPTGRPAFLCCAYPGLLPGNAPWINAHGVIMTTNFIHTREVRVGGVGRYLLDRLTLEAGSFDEALAVATHRERAYGFHHVIASAREGRIASVEATPSRLQIKPLGDGIFLHTNHLIHGGLADVAQDPDYVQRSSLTRWRVLARWRQRVADPGALGADDLVRALSSHEGRPYSPCRHPTASISGATLLSAVFELPAAATMRVYTGQPCGGRRADHAAPR
jgi:hypothetical protein